MENLEKLLQIEIDKLPYTKHLDDGQYNDGQITGFELGARWAFELLHSKLLNHKQHLIKQIEYVKGTDEIYRQNQFQLLEKLNFALDIIT